jgi:hypothetical protein
MTSSDLNIYMYYIPLGTQIGLGAWQTVSVRVVDEEAEALERAEAEAAARAAEEASRKSQILSKVRKKVTRCWWFLRLILSWNVYHLYTLLMLCP